MSCWEQENKNIKAWVEFEKTEKNITKEDKDLTWEIESDNISEVNYNLWEWNDKDVELIDLKEENVFSLWEVIDLCKSECWKDLDAYCLWEKSFLSNDNVISWTCRIFAKYNKLFTKCKWFCKEIWGNYIKCTNLDWSLNEWCN